MNNEFEKAEDPSGVLASPPPINWQEFGKHAEAMEQAFGKDPVFNLWLMCLGVSKKKFDRLLKEMKHSGDPVKLIRAKLAKALRTE